MLVGSKSSGRNEKKKIKRPLVENILETLSSKIARRFQTEMRKPLLYIQMLYEKTQIREIKIDNMKRVNTKKQTQLRVLL